MVLREDDVVFCTVKKIEGTTVFLKLEGGDEGSMVLSEVAAGRIRNLREYVSINKKIVCKVLRLSSGHIELSLRRVTAKERDEVLERYKKEKALSNILRAAGEKPEPVIAAIKAKYEFMDFFESAIEDKKIFEEFLSADKAAKVFEILTEKEAREKTVERKFKLMSLAGDGVLRLQEVLDVDYEIHYLGSSSFSVSASAKDFKDANARLDAALEVISERAKKKDVKFAVVTK